MVTKIARLMARRGSYIRYIKEKPSWFLVLLLGRLLIVRRVIGAIRRASYHGDSVQGDGIVLVPPVNDVLAGLHSQGLYCGISLPEDACQAIQQFARTQRCGTRDTSEPMFLPGEYAEMNRSRDHDILSGYYFDQVAQCETITRIEQDRALHAISAGYLQADPVHIRTRLWWNFPARRINEADLFSTAQDAFHFDVNDWRTLKFFFYLTDCDASSGAHRCIPGSHRRRKLSHQFSLFAARPIEELERFYGPDAVRSIEGRSGFGFAEDPFLFHTGTVCKDEPRLILEVEFGNRQLSSSYKYGQLG